MFKAIEKEGLQGGKNGKSRVVRHRHIHDPGIQQEPHFYREPSESDDASELLIGTVRKNDAKLPAVCIRTPRRMKMTSCCPATQKKDRLPPKRLVARSLFTWCRAPVEELDPDIRRHHILSPAFRTEAEHATETLSLQMDIPDAHR